MIGNVENNSMLFVHDNFDALFTTGKDELVYKSILSLYLTYTQSTFFFQIKIYFVILMMTRKIK